eukprot:TRINITY_DN7373_c0_g1_i1.p1 TRINITY_DN7373_c0_g1~~TRINITY_DN7373_c0_g1_i1.p1  ORF type:complete len:300 (-),score=52.48 TRINITY_DN7373_c0_g1_i1:116-952(-)
MAPVKFDDLPKPASSVLGDDFQVSGFQFKSKQKTSYQKTEVTAVVDILHPSEEKTKTPAKLTWKIPCPFGISFFNVDKLETDKTGNVKLEASSDKVYAGLKIDVKSDLMNPRNDTVGCIYTGIENTRVQVDTKAKDPKDFSVDLTRTVGDAVTVGIKCNRSNLTKPDVGMRFVPGHGFFASLLAKEKISVFTAHFHYNLNSDVQIAGTCQLGGKGAGSFSAGATYVPFVGTTLKAKIQHDKTMSLSAKYVLAKGFTLLSGAKLDSKGKHTCGFQLSVE